jgi:Tfp pilus assembly protein PilO
MQELRTKKADNDTMLTLAEQLQRKRDELHDAYTAISPEERENLTKLLPDTVDNVRLILDISNIAAESGIEIRDISVTREGEQLERRQTNTASTITTSNDIGTITLSFSVEATYEKFVGFIKSLERALRLVDIRALEINPSRGDNIFYNFDITLDTYWLR